MRVGSCAGLDARFGPVPFGEHGSISNILTPGSTISYISFEQSAMVHGWSLCDRFELGRIQHQLDALKDDPIRLAEFTQECSNRCAASRMVRIVVCNCSTSVINIMNPIQFRTDHQKWLATSYFTALEVTKVQRVNK